MNRNDFLIEVYTEELPPKCITEFEQQLPYVVGSVLNNYQTEYKKIETYLTPVRIIILVNDVGELTNKKVVEIVGPPEKIGIKNGQFTQAAIGFAKKFNVELKELFIKETQNGKFLCVKKTYGGECFKSLIPKILTDILSQLKYHKMMVWESSKFSFPRPIRNLLVLYGNEVVKVKLSFITSSNFTYGIKTSPLKKIKISKSRKISLIEEYFNVLKNECIIYDTNKRIDALLKSIDNITSKKKIKYDNDQQLLNEIVAITEYPSCILCDFPKEFLQLPKEFIVICMKTKQKFIPLYDNNGNLLNMFIGVKNGPSEYLEHVKEGFQRVLIARLNDVKYYYETDSKIEFNLYFDKLKGVVYNEKLKSSYYDKIVRIYELAKLINRQFKFCDEEQISIAVKLIKNDLVTQIVYEYPELQGVAGRIYATEYCKKNTLPIKLAYCCEQHLKPRSYEDSIPEDNLSTVLSLADKISTIIDNTVVDNLPTGSSDPIGLKRTADGVIKICKEKHLDINLTELFNFYINLLTIHVDIDKEKIFDKFLVFLTSRFENILVSEGYNIDEIRSVLFNFNGEFDTKWIILSTLKVFRTKPEFEKFIELYKRIHNILQQGEKKSLLPKTEETLDENFLQRTEEKILYTKILNVKKQVETLYSKKQFVDIINLLLELKPDVDRFFDAVLVFDNNIDVAKNRLKLLNELRTLFFKIGALHLIQGMDK